MRGDDGTATAAGCAGAVLVTVGALLGRPGLIHVYAGLALLVLAWWWYGRGASTRPWLTLALWAGLATGATAAATTVAVTAAVGTGYGWIGALGTPISSDNWSPTGLLGRWTAAVFAPDDVGAALSVQLWRWAGVLATLVVAGLVWTYRDRIGPLPGLGLVLFAVVAFGPALRPWYVVWALLPLAAGWPASHRWLAVLCTVLTPVVLPDGYRADLTEVLAAALGVLLGAAVFGLVSRPAVARAVPR